MARLHTTGRSHDLSRFGGMAGSWASSALGSIAVRALFPHRHAIRAGELREARAAARVQALPAATLEQTAN